MVLPIVPKSDLGKIRIKAFFDASIYCASYSTTIFKSTLPINVDDLFPIPNSKHVMFLSYFSS